MRCLLLFAIWLAAEASLLGQEYPHRVYTVKDGLPSSKVHDITQDASGRLWVATKAGVTSWDGRTWEIFNVAHGLHWAEQFALRWGANGKLWAVSRRGPFRLFLRGDEGWTEVATLEAAFPADAEITAFELWRPGGEEVPVIGTDQRGLLVYRNGHWQAMGIAEGLPDERVRALVALGERLVIGTLGGLAEWVDPGQIVPLAPGSMPNPAVTGLAREEDGGPLWVLGERFLGRLNGGRIDHLLENFECPSPSAPKKAVADGQGGLYFANQQALFYFHPALGLERLGRSNGLPTEGAFALFFDREDNLWVGGARGLTKVITRRFGKYTRLQGLLDDEVTATLERRNGEMIFGHRGGLSRLRDDVIEALPLPGARAFPEEQLVQDLTEDAGGNLWVAARRAGLARIDPAGQVRWFGAEEGLPGPVVSVLADTEGRLWASSDQGLFLLRGNRFERPVATVPRLYARRIFEGSGGEVRLATVEGLFQLTFEENHSGVSGDELQGAQWRRFSCENSGACNSVFAVFERPGGGLWAGTAEGLYRTQGNRLVEETNPSLPNPVYSIFQDRSGRVWFGTDNGARRWNGLRLESFTVREGLAGRETYRAAGMVDSRGDVWIGTEHGVTVYRERVPAPLREPPILDLVAVEVSGRRLGAEQPLTLDAGDNDLAFHYRAMSLVDEQRIRIGYQLEGFEERQVVLSSAEQVVRYPNLEPGEYRFRIAAGSPEDVWSDEVLSAPLVIKRPLLQQPWLYLLFAGVLALAVYGAQNFYAQRRYSRELEVEVAQRVEELHASEERYRRIFERNRAAMLILDGDALAILDANRAACVLYGYPLEELQQLTHGDLLVSEGSDSLDRLTMDSRTHLMVERHRTKSGAVHDVETYASAILVEGRPMLFVIVHDVTERRLVEESMLTEKERLAITLRHIDDGVITMDHQGKILLLNRQAEAITGWSSVEAVGQSLESVLRLDRSGDGGRLMELLDSAWDAVGDELPENAFELTTEAEVRQRGGERRVLEISGSPIRQLSGDVSGWVLAFRDVTEKKQIDEELIRAQKMEALGILAGGIAHDFNNLLTILLGNLSLLGNGAILGPRERSNLENAETAVLRARDLAQQLLTFSRGGAPVRQAASMAEVVRESANFVMRGSKVRAEVEMAEDLWVVEIDPGQINQVLNNLLINATQSMPGGGTVRIRGENLERPPGILPAGRHIAIHITDEGTGIDEEHLDRIFDPYFTTKKGGRGLGLTTAYSIVKQHGGLLTVHGEPDVGTTFSIYLPATEEPLEEPPRPEGWASGGVGKILVMDDDDGVRLVLESIIERLGYEVVAVADGAGAVAAYGKGLEEEEPFTAVIMDLTIPGGMGGQEALEHLLELDPAVRAIVVSGYSNNPVLASYLDYGFRGRVSKPFKPEELAAVLSQVLDDDMTDDDVTVDDVAVDDVAVDDVAEEG